MKLIKSRNTDHSINEKENNMDQKIDFLKASAKAVAKLRTELLGDTPDIDYEPGCIKAAKTCSGDDRELWYKNISENNLWVNENGFIESTKDDGGSMAGFIPGVAMYRNLSGKAEEQFELYEPAIIANTVNGFRFSGIADNDCIVDHGPVSTPVLVGISAPEALLVPLNNHQAIKNGIEFLVEYLVASKYNAHKPESDENTSRFPYPISEK